MKTETMEDARKAALDRAKDGEYYFAITLKETGKVIGEIDAMPEATAPDEENAARDTFSPCWMLNPEYHGKGYAYEAAHAFFDYLFNEKGARRIYAYTEDYNLASQKLCEKLGMRREGLFMEFVSFVPPQRDSNKDYHGITCEKHEYLAKKPKILRIEPTSSQKTMNRTIKTMHQIALVFALGSCIKNA